jgi:hypothetical protein
MEPGEADGPFALALSARSNVLREFEGGPARSAYTEGMALEERSAEPNHTAASASPPPASTGWPPASAQAHP